MAAAVAGLAFGGGCEFALAAHHRVLAYDKGAAMGLPEGYDGWNNGHLEGASLTTGTLRLGDRSYQVDCVDGINKSQARPPTSCTDNRV